MILKTVTDLKGRYNDIQMMEVIHRVLMAWILPFHKEHTKFSIFVTDSADDLWRLWQINKLSGYVSVVLISNQPETVPEGVWVISSVKFEDELMAQLKALGRP